MSRATKGPDDRQTAILSIALLIAAMSIALATGLFKIFAR